MEAVKTVRYRAVVAGRVQGVYYRASCAERARGLGLSGWVRNRSEGTVELEVQGEEPAVRELLAWCRQGPELARVDHLDCERIEVEPPESGRFSITW